jgi:hypothetical protein
MAEPEPVSVRDLEVADRIARGVRSGRAADRRPTVEQLVAAFGEAEPTADARRRAGRALALAGVATVPDLLETSPGQRVLLEVRHVRRRRALFLGLLALMTLFAAAALATQVDLGSSNTAADLPAGTTTATAAATTATNTVAPETTTTAATARATSAKRRRARRVRRARARRAAARRARARRVGAAGAAARRRVTVRLSASSPTFLCVDGDGRQLFDGTLTGSRTFRGRVVRLNVGLGPSTRVTANGRPVPLTASPTGVELTPKRRTLLPLGSRPCA